MRAAATAAGVDTGADAYRPRRGHRPHRGPRRRRRRLPHQTVQPRRTVRPVARAVTARAIPRPPTLEAGDLRLDPSEHRVWRADTEIRLSHKEFTLLEALIRRPGIVHTRAQLLERCWDAAYEARSNIVDVYIRYLRDKIDRPFGVTSLETIRGAGYRLRKDGGRHALPR